MEEEGEQPVTLEQAIGLFQSIPDSDGRVFLVGEIVQAGQAMDIEVAITAPTDREAIAAALPMLSGRLRFRRVPGEPDEMYVEVTPGSEPRPGGADPDMAGAIRA
jgi:hypothetical protein